jgi:hypothetical protein
MRNKHGQFGAFSSTTEMQNSNFAPVYYYLFTGILLLIAVFLFLPRVASG